VGSIAKYRIANHEVFYVGQLIKKALRIKWRAEGGKSYFVKRKYRYESAFTNSLPTEQRIDDVDDDDIDPFCAQRNLQICV